LFLAQLPAFEHGRPSIDGIERRPQLVRERGEELILGAVGGLRGLPCRLGRAIEPRIVAHDRDLVHHGFREQQIDRVIAAVGFGDRERHCPNARSRAIIGTIIQAATPSC
jgi:hypothetical protein